MPFVGSNISDRSLGKSSTIDRRIETLEWDFHHKIIVFEWTNILRFGRNDFSSTNRKHPPAHLHSEGADLIGSKTAEEEGELPSNEADDRSAWASNSGVGRIDVSEAVANELPLLLVISGEGEEG